MIRKIGHIIVSLLVFMSAAGIVVNSHYCQGQFKNLALFVQAENCHTKLTKNKKCQKHATTQKNTCTGSDEKNCCESESDYIASEVDLIKVQVEPLNLDLRIVHASGVPAFHTGLQGVTHILQHFQNYRPPLLFRDIPLSKQSLLC